jgi:4-aminobutyrate aminotransferase
MLTLDSACAHSAAAVETQRVIRDERLVQNANTMGERLQAGLHGVASRHGSDVVRDVRGLGCMIGLELNAQFAAGTAKAVATACAGRGMLLLPCSVYETLRFIPPLTVSADEVQHAIEIFDDALAEVVSQV